MPSFAQNLEKTLHAALDGARERRHEYATLEHLLLALIADEDAAEVMGACGVDLAELADVVRTYLDQEYQSLKAEESGEPQPTAGFQRVVQRAILHVQSSGKDTVTGANVLVALFSERDSYAVYFLQQQDMSRLDAVSFISHGIGKGGQAIEPRSPRGADEAEAEEKEEAKGNKKETALDQFTVNLNAKAQGGKIDPLIGRGPEVDRTIQILCRRSKNNPLYVGDPGVGKTAIAEGLARTIEDNGNMFGFGVVDQLHHHLGETEDCVDWRAVGTGHRRQGVVGAENEARAVDQENVFGLFAHLVTATPEKSFCLFGPSPYPLHRCESKGHRREFTGRPLAVPWTFSGRRPAIARSS